MKKFYSCFLVVLFSLNVLYLNAQNNVSFTTSFPDACGPVSLTLTNNSVFTDTVGAGHYEWLINGELYSTSASPADTLMPAGNHHIFLRFWDDGGFYSDYSRTIHIKGVGNIRTFPQDICPNQEVNFFVEGNPDWVVWIFSNGDTIREKTTTHTFTSTGTFKVKAFGATYACGLDSTERYVTVSSTVLPKAEIWLNGTQFCPNDEVVFRAPDAATHRWIINGDSIYGKEVRYAFSSPGTYPVQLRTTNTCGNSNTASTSVIVAQNTPSNAAFSISYENNFSCPNHKVTFEAQVAGSYEWDFGDGGMANTRVADNTYSRVGTYPVKLVTRNGCGETDTATQQVIIGLHPEDKPNVEIFFDEFRESDTVVSCPGVQIALKSEVRDSKLRFEWTAEGTTFTEQELTRPFDIPGVNEVRLIVTNRCSGKDTAYKYVNINPQIEPVTDLEVMPLEICPNEEVYFFDQGYFNDENIQNLTYDIDFGDGTSITGITEPTNISLPAMAAHRYTTQDTFNFIFVAQNRCGVRDTLEGEIRVNDNADRVPFYYIGNSTIDREGGDVEDWSAPSYNAHAFTVPLELLNWGQTHPMDSIVTLFAWYGDIMTNPDLGEPDGFVRVKAPVSTLMYVPFNITQPEVSFAVGWFCNPDNLDSEPQLLSFPKNANDETVATFPLEPNGQTSINSSPYSASLILDASDWQEGPCLMNNDEIRNRWYYKSGHGSFVVLTIFDNDDNNLQYDLHIGNDKDNTQTLVSKGYLRQLNDTTLNFIQSDVQLCPESNFRYEFAIANNQLSLENMTDTCDHRLNLLAGKSFKIDGADWEYDHLEDITGCPGDSVELYISGGTSYTWMLSDALTTTESRFKHVYPNVGEFNELVLATNSCGRVDSIYTTVVIDTTNLPEAYWFADKLQVFRNEEVQFYVSHMNPYNENDTYLWEFGDGNTSTEMQPIHSYRQEGEYTVSLTVTNGCGSTTQEHLVRVVRRITNCDAKFTYNIEDKTVTFSNNSTGQINSYLWIFGDGHISNSTEPVYTFQDYGVYNVYLIVHDTITNCSSESFATITVGSVDCFAEFTYYVNETSRSIVFENQSIGNISSWYWEFGDGMFSNDTSPTHSYTRPGIYPVCLTVRNNATGCLSHICHEVAIGDSNMHADYSYFIEQDDNRIVFTDASEGEITNWYWEFGDGNWDTVPNPTHTYAVGDEYNVCLRIFNRHTFSTDHECKEIVIADTSDVIVDAQFTYFINPDNREVRLINTSTGNITNKYWILGDGTHANTDTVVHTYTSSGFYPVCLAVFNSATGESDEMCVQLQIGSLTCNTSAEFSYYVEPVTREVNFTNLTTGNANLWFWDFGDGNTSSRSNPSHVYSQPGFYHVSLAVRDTVNDCSDYIAQMVQVGVADCNADFEFTVTDLVTNQVKFTEHAIGNIGVYFWDFDDGTYSYETNPMHSFSEPGLYKVKLTVRNNLTQCMDHIEKDVQIGDISCSADFSVYVDSLSNTAYFINSTLGGATDFNWSFGDGSYQKGLNPIHQYIAPGFFTVSLNTHNPTNGCIDSEEKTILISSVGNDIHADFIAQSNFETNTLVFSNLSLGNNLTYLWSFGDGATSTEENPTHTYTENGYNYVCLTASNIATDMVNTVCKNVLVSNEEATNCLSEFNYDIDSSSFTVVFSDQSVGNPTSYLWDFGDNTTSTEANPTHTYSEAGYYPVSLLTANSATNCESQEYKYINVGAGNTGIKAYFTYTVDTISETKGKPVDIIGLSVGGGARLIWDFGDKTAQKSNIVDIWTLRPHHVYASPGVYNVCLTIEDPIISQSNTYCDSVDVTEPVVFVDELANTREDNISIYPNPMYEFTHIDYELVKTSNVNISLYDTKGSLIEVLINTYKPSGKHSVLWRNRNLDAGIYYLVLNTTNKTITKKIVIKD